MTSYKTYLKWKSFIEEYQAGGYRSKKAFCEESQINYQRFIAVTHDEKFGLIKSPDPKPKPVSKPRKARKRKARKAPKPPGPPGRMTFARVIIRKEEDYEPQF